MDEDFREMSIKCEQPSQQRSKERGSIIIMTAILMLLLFLMVGLCIDVSRIYMVRAELQNAADAAALTAARELDSGTTGIDRAVTQANAIVNTQGFGKAGVTIASVEFAVAADGPFLSAASAKNAATVKTIRYVRASTQTTSTTILFALNALGASHVESRNAVAGMSIGINGFCDYYPIALAKTNPSVSYPVNTPLDIHFKDNTGTIINLPDKHFIVLDTPWVTGNGADETRDAVAGVSPRCTRLNDVLDFSKSPSANAVNGPEQVELGTNTRFYVYPPGNQLTYSNAKPATNIFGANPGETITFSDYNNANPATTRTPAQTGVFDRRLLLLPIIEPIPNAQNPTGVPHGKVVKFGYFFLRQAVNGDCPKKVKGVNVPCPAGTTAPGDLLLEYLGDNFAVARGIVDPTSCSSKLSVAVLYR
jgi:Flp pilus assembly protein TadG